MWHGNEALCMSRRGNERAPCAHLSAYFSPAVSLAAIGLKVLHADPQFPCEACTSVAGRDAPHKDCGGRNGEAALGTHEGASEPFVGNIEMTAESAALRDQLADVQACRAVCPCLLSARKRYPFPVRFTTHIRSKGSKRPCGKSSCFLASKECG